ncbi:MAG: bis(5'-nucleosyl)-tetraphosphatase (symmetrical) YqeK [Coriobacteriia bacterium]|nr:bis(5'-nucleosyl)-tetraphosphatase (symmetrical) YqeK [Coriobacteriia bacterium]
MNDTFCEEAAHIYARARHALEQRLTEYRFIHSVSVADTAADIARVYGVDVEQARLAGLLHDWDKNYSDSELIERAQAFGITVRGDEEDMVALIHAKTGAIALRQEFPELSDEIIQAIDRHTSAAKDMSDLDMILYIADMIEPLRTRGNLAPLRVLVGKIPLEELFVRSYETTMRHLILRHRFIHPDSIEIWNAYIQHERMHSQRQKQDVVHRRY